jgi:hypothetical protein
VGQPTEPLINQLDSNSPFDIAKPYQNVTPAISFKTTSMPDSEESQLCHNQVTPCVTNKDRASYGENGMMGVPRRSGKRG